MTGRLPPRQKAPDSPAPPDEPPTGFAHTPVLLDETIQVLNPRPGGRFVDGTLGGGGHAEALLEATAPDGAVLGLDRDSAAIRAASARLARFGDRLRVAQRDFRELADAARRAGFDAVDGVLLDLGVSSHQLDAPERGFSFRHDAPLDMRMDQTGPRTAADLVNELPERDLADLLFAYGEETRSRAVARAIARQRERAPIVTTGRLAEIVARTLGGHHGRIHPATRTFQALRIAVNDELGAVEAALPAAVDLLRPGGRLAVISFHSLEDRIVKRFVAAGSRPCVCPPGLPVCVCGRVARLRPVTKKPVEAGHQERQNNARSRSAKLRAAEKVC